MNRNVFDSYLVSKHIFALQRLLQLFFDEVMCFIEKASRRCKLQRFSAKIKVKLLGPIQSGRLSLGSLQTAKNGQC